MRAKRRCTSPRGDGTCRWSSCSSQHGADPLRRRADGRTPHTLAELHGNHDIATWLLAHGAKDELSPLEQFVAACARGDRAAREAMFACPSGAARPSCAPSITS